MAVFLATNHLEQSSHTFLRYGKSYQNKNNDENSTSIIHMTPFFCHSSHKDDLIFLSYIFYHSFSNPVWGWSHMHLLQISLNISPIQPSSNTSSSSVEGIPRCFQISWETEPLQRVLGLPWQGFSNFSGIDSFSIVIIIVYKIPLLIFYIYYLIAYCCIYK